MTLTRLDPGGEVVVISLSLTTVNGTLAPPKVTWTAPVNPVPLISTLVPPEVGPAAGDRLVTAGTVSALAAVPSATCSPSRPGASAAPTTTARNSQFSLIRPPLSGALHLYPLRPFPEGNLSDVTAQCREVMGNTGHLLRFRVH